MKVSHKTLTLSIGLLCIALVACLLWLHLSAPQRPISSNTAATSTSTAVAAAPTTALVVFKGISFEIATSSESQMKGLGGRTSIPSNYAMLFVFPTNGSYGFWMKDTLISIDMVWVSDKGQIVSVNNSVSPATYPHVFYPPQPIKYVLETQAGFSKKIGWTVGANIALPPLP